MFRNRIEYERPEEQERRYNELITARQRTYEFFWDLRQTFGLRLGRWLFGGLTETALRQLDIEDVGRRRFFKVIGPIRIPIP